MTSYPTPIYDCSADDQVKKLAMFRRTCECAGPLNTLSEEVRDNYALVWLDPCGQSVTTLNPIKKEDKKPLKTLCSAISDHITPKIKHRMVKDKRHTLSKEPEESMHEYITRYTHDITRHIALCKYADSDEQTIDPIIFGVNDDQIRRTLMEQDSLTLQTCIHICKTTRHCKITDTTYERYTTSIS